MRSLLLIIPPPPLNKWLLCLGETIVILYYLCCCSNVSNLARVIVEYMSKMVCICIWLGPVAYEDAETLLWDSKCM